MMLEHGGNIWAMREESDKGGMLDLSASINPLGMPQAAIKAIQGALKNRAEACAHYPDPECTVLRQSIAAKYGIDQKKIIAANGSTELIYLIPRMLKPKRVLVTAPAFSEFERAAEAAGAKVTHLPLDEKDGFSVHPDKFIKAMDTADMAVICNPNNPTGRLLEGESVLEIARGAKRKKCVLVIDEAFMDFCPGASVLGVDNPYLIVLRSLTKFYALAGLRLGFGYFPPALSRRIQKLKEPWSVNTLSQLAGAAALSDRADKTYAARTIKLIDKQRARLHGGLTALGLECSHSSANYLTVKCANASKVTSALMDRGVAVRDCSNFRGMGRSYIRIAVRDAKAVDAVINAMASIKKVNK